MELIFDVLTKFTVMLVFCSTIPNIGTLLCYLMLYKVGYTVLSPFLRTINSLHLPVLQSISLSVVNFMN